MGIVGFGGQRADKVPIKHCMAPQAVHFTSFDVADNVPPCSWMICLPNEPFVYAGLES